MRPTVRNLRDRTGGPALDLRNALRRMVIAATDAVLWALSGFEADGSVEREEAEVFPGIGFYARPAANSDGAEAIVIKVGGQSGHPAIVATRDQRALEALERVAGRIGAGEAVMFTANVMVKLTSAGQILAGSPGGPFAPLPTMADINALRNWVATHVHGGVTAGPASTLSGPATNTPQNGTSPPNAAGTTRLRAQ